MRQEEVRAVLQQLDNRYGTKKDGFFHKEPWQLLMAIMLSAQSTDVQVDEVLPELFGRFEKVEEMAEAETEEIEEIIKSIGLYHNKARNMKKCCIQLVEQFHKEVPDTLEELVSLAGVGRKTANLFLADQFQIPGITVDTHVKRISNRLGWADSEDAEKVEYQLQKVLPKDHWIRINIQLIRHGRAVCKSRNPKCKGCMLAAYCAYGKKQESQPGKAGNETGGL